MRLEPGRAPVRDGSIILVQHGARHVGIAVDEVMDVQAVQEDSVETGARGETRGGLVRGLGHLEDDVVALVDIHMLVTQVVL